MALKIRLSRGGAKKRPYYRIVVADSHKARDGRFIERLGTYNPLLPREHEERVTLKEERIKYWLGVGAKPSDRVARFLGEAEMIPMPARKNNPQKAKPKAKAQERLAEAEEAKKAAEEAAKAPAPEPEAPAEEAAPEEAPAEESAAEKPAAEEVAAEAPAEEAPAEKAAAEEPAAKEAPAEEAAAEEESGEKS